MHYILSLIMATLIFPIKDTLLLKRYSHSYVLIYQPKNKNILSSCFTKKLAWSPKRCSYPAMKDTVLHFRVFWGEHIFGLMNKLTFFLFTSDSPSRSVWCIFIFFLQVSVLCARIWAWNRGLQFFTHGFLFCLRKVCRKFAVEFRCPLCVQDSSVALPLKRFAILLLSCL
jgi:hypothetical protein